MLTSDIYIYIYVCVCVYTYTYTYTYTYIYTYFKFLTCFVCFAFLTKIKKRDDASF